jgi:hypothetical protein
MSDLTEYETEVVQDRVAGLTPYEARHVVQSHRMKLRDGEHRLEDLRMQIETLERAVLMRRETIRLLEEIAQEGEGNG